MRTTLAAVALALLASTAARAADLPQSYSKAPASFDQRYNWSGFYLGINGGGAWGSADSSNNSVTTDQTLFGGPPAGAFATFPGPDRNIDLSGGFGGVTIGGNWQTGNVVLGLEADFQGAGIDGDDSFTAGIATYDTKVKIDWFGTVRGRLGYAFDRVLPYVTGGVVYSHSKRDLTVTTPLTGSVRTASLSGTDVGWTIGAGVEMALAGNWSVKAEYLYEDFGVVTSDFDFGGGNVVHNEADTQINLVRAGLNYRF